MVAAIVGLGVPLKVVGLRNNKISEKGAEQLLRAVKSNKNIIEATIGDDKTKEITEEGQECEKPPKDDDILSDLTKAISLRCIYHSCLQDDTPLLDTHLSGLGSSWPRVVGLAFGDIKGLKLPLAGILGNHPDGYDLMVKQFRSKPEVSDDVLHTACRTGKVKAVVSLLENCKCDPGAQFNGKVPLELALNPSFDSPEGGRALRLLAIDKVITKITDDSLAQSLFLKAATHCPVAIDILMEVGLKPEDMEEVAETAVQQRCFGTTNGREVLKKRLLSKSVIESIDDRGRSILISAAEHFEDDHHGILHEIVSSGIPIEYATRSALHIVCEKVASEQDLELLRKLITTGHKEEVADINEEYEDTDEEDDDSSTAYGATCLEISAAVSPVVTSYLVDQGFIVSIKALESACRNPKYNNSDHINHLSKLITPDVIATKNSRALHIACKNGLVRVASQVLAAGMVAHTDMKSPILQCCKCVRYAWGSCDESQKVCLFVF